MADPICELCDFTGPMQPLYPALSVVRCPQCRLVFYTGPVDSDSLYSGEYFAGREYRDYAADQAIHQRNFRWRIEFLRRLRPTGKLLEIGCAYGFFLHLAARHWDARGLDITREGVEFARSRLGVRAELADFLDLPDEPGAYDVICLWDTLEHLPHPVHCLQKAARWLAPGGILALTTNDVDSLLARWRKHKWRQMHPPTHVYYFSRATLRQTMDKCGLDTLYLRTLGQYRSFKSILHGLLELRTGRPSRLANLLTGGGRLDIPIYLNTRDIVMLAARKPDCGPGDAATRAPE